MPLRRIAQCAMTSLVVTAAAAIPAVTAAVTVPATNYTSGVLSVVDRQTMTLNVDDNSYSAGGAVGLAGFHDGNHVGVTFTIVNGKRIALTLTHSPDGGGVALAS